jgi:hypothetical protein
MLDTRRTNMREIRDVLRPKLEARLSHEQTEVDPEFGTAVKVGLEALGGMKTVKQIAQDYGVHPVHIGQWKR